MCSESDGFGIPLMKIHGTPIVRIDMSEIITNWQRLDNTNRYNYEKWLQYLSGTLPYSTLTPQLYYIVLSSTTKVGVFTG